MIEIVRDLRAALFPTHYGVSDFTETSLDFFGGNRLDASLRALQEQVRRCLRYSAENGFPRHLDGSLVKGQPRHPMIEDDVVIYAGATVLGRITIGRGSTGRNVWVTEDVPAGSHITQAKIRHEDQFEGGAGS